MVGRICFQFSPVQEFFVVVFLHAAFHHYSIAYFYFIIFNLPHKNMLRKCCHPQLLLFFKSTRTNLLVVNY